jgi:aminopeptidase
MHDPRVNRLAELLVRYSVRLKPGDKLILAGMPLAEPLLEACYRSALEAGAFVDVRVLLPSLDEIFFKTANEEQLRNITPMADLQVEGYDARIIIPADPNTRALTNVDPARQAAFASARQRLMRRMMERTASGEYRWVSFFYPTNAYAQDAGMSMAEYTDFAFGSCFLDDPDPIARWEELGRRQDRLIEWLRDKKEIRLVGPDTDLTFSVAGRRWINCSGQNNMPDGEVFTGPVEDSVNGHVRFTYPATAHGRLVEDVRLRFEKGKVVEAHAAQNEAFLLEMLDSDEGARRLGEFSFGTNPHITQFTREIAYDEKIGGTVHMAVGASIPESGGVNRSGVHWDMVCDLRQGGAAYADGELFMQDGKFVVGR